MENTPFQHLPAKAHQGLPPGAGGSGCCARLPKERTFFGTTRLVEPTEISTKNGENLH